MKKKSNMSLLVPLVNVYIMERSDDPVLKTFDEDLNGPRNIDACDEAINLQLILPA